MRQQGMLLAAKKVSVQGRLLPASVMRAVTIVRTVAVTSIPLVLKVTTKETARNIT